ncbi:VirB4 family type IV secretion system protein [Candidatus Altiarchaeota archaeon]
MSLLGMGGSKPKKETHKEYEDILIEYLTSPSTILVHKQDIQITKFHQVITAINYPRLVDPGWLTRLIEMNLDFDLAMHIVPYSTGSTVKMLENEIKKQKTDIYALETEGKIVPQALIQQHEDTMMLLSLIQQGTEKMFDLSLLLDAKAYTEEDLAKVTKQIQSTMNSLMITPKIPSFQMYKALKSTLPLADNQLAVTRNITSSACAACFPFAITSLEHHTTGILIGFNEFNGIPIIVDPFELNNPNILVLGTSGGGKSYTIKLLLMREFMEGVHINIIDPQAEYTDLVHSFNGKVIKIAPGSDSIVNPFDLMDQTYDEKKLSLLSFFRVLLGELTEEQWAILDESIDHTYDERGITKDPKTWSKEPPTLEDLYNEILPLTRSKKEMIYRPAMNIVNKLKTYVFGPMRFLNQQTKIDLNNRMVSFDIKDAPEVGKGVLMFLILEYVYTEMKKSKNRKMLAIDEAWTVLSAGDQAEYVLKIVKTCRKFNLGLIMITQDVEDVLNSRAGRAVLTNTATKFILKQDSSVINDMQEKFHLNDPEVHFIKTATAGRALLLSGNSRIPVFITSSPEEHRLITTKPDELLQKEQIQQPEGIDLVKHFDINKRVQIKAELSDDQIQVLEERDFEEIRVSTLFGENELFLVRNETDETDEHFVLQELVYQEIKQYTDRVLVHHTKLPDVTLETKDGRMVAIEIEADVGLKRSLQNMEEKMSVLQKYDDYFFLVTNPTLIKQYREKFGEMLTRTQVAEKIATYYH